MDEEIIYFRQFPNCRKKDKNGNLAKYQGEHFNLSKLPTETLKKEFRSYIIYRGKNGIYSTLKFDRCAYNHVVKFLNSSINRNINSLLDRTDEKWISLLKGWMIQNGMKITKTIQQDYEKANIGNADTIRYFKRILHFIEPEDFREEIEKDIWCLNKLNIEIRKNPIKGQKTLNFTKIIQFQMREECKKAVYMNLKCEALGTVALELITMRKFSAYLHKEHPEINSFSEVDRDVLEGFLIDLMMSQNAMSTTRGNVKSLRNQLETIGKIYNYERLEHLFLNTDIPSNIQAEFKVYSDEEIKRLNAEITKMDEQIARCMIIHQMLGTRISDTLTLKRDCIHRINGQYIIEIKQIKTGKFQKPVSKDIVDLLQRSIKYTEKKYGNTDYIFVSPTNPNRPMQYASIRTNIITMIRTKQLKDDNGNMFRFETHMFRRYYGAKLTEMHLDDWTIARLLGHKGISSVKHYRKMSNQKMAEETREIRKLMSDIIFSTLSGWGEEYEQIRQDD